MQNACKVDVSFLRCTIKIMRRKKIKDPTQTEYTSYKTHSVLFVVALLGYHFL